MTISSVTIMLVSASPKNFFKKKKEKLDTFWYNLLSSLTHINAVSVQKKSFITAGNMSATGYCTYCTENTTCRV